MSDGGPAEQPVQPAPVRARPSLRARLLAWREGWRSEEHQTGQLDVQTIHAHRRLLDQFAKGRAPRLLFPPVLESAFRAYCRNNAQPARLTLSLLTALLMLTAGGWGGQLLQLPPAALALTETLGLMLAPLFVLATGLVAWRPRSAWVEAVFLLVFLLQAIAIELVRAAAAREGYLIAPVISVCVPVAVLAIGRPSMGRALLFVVVYLLVVAVAVRTIPVTVNALVWTSRVTVVVLVSIVVVATAFSQRTRRQTWALLQLTRLGTLVDYLTGLPNRSAFERHYERWTRLSRRERQPYTLAVLDLDFFKRVNDRYGHPYGDGVLNEMALTLESYARRPGDFIARLGGEEFVLFLYGCSLETARERLEDLRRGLELLAIENVDSPYGCVTASIGAVTLAQPESLAQSYEKADQNLYAAKAAGRNRLVHN